MVGRWGVVNRSNIEWCTGCTKVSPGCAHCYAEAWTLRFRRGPRFLPGISEVKLHPARLNDPLGVQEPARVFVCSMSDLFHEAVPYDFIAEVMRRTWWPERRHTFQLLTKRPERMRAFFDVYYDVRHWMRPLPNVWLGTSVFKHRIDVLRETPAALRFLSLEPLLGDVGELNLDGIGWVIVGGESGRRARPMEPAWARSVRDQCAAAGVPFFYKQSGATVGHGAHVLDGVAHMAYPDAA